MGCYRCGIEDDERFTARLIGFRMEGRTDRALCVVCAALLDEWMKGEPESGIHLQLREA